MKKISLILLTLIATGSLDQPIVFAGEPRYISRLSGDEVSTSHLDKVTTDDQEDIAIGYRSFGAELADNNQNTLSDNSDVNSDDLLLLADSDRSFRQIIDDLAISENIISIRIYQGLCRLRLLNCS